MIARLDPDPERPEMDGGVPSRRPRRPLRDRLPEVYRRRGGDVLRRFVEAVDDILAGVEGELRRAAGGLAPLLESRFPGLTAGGGCAGGPQGPGGSEGPVPEGFPAGGGTLGGLRAHLAREGARPWIWPALRAEVVDAARLRFVRTWRRAVLIAWAADGDAPPAAVERAIAALPGLLPCGCHFQTVWLERPPASIPPLPGVCVRGRWLAGATEKQLSRAGTDRV